MTIHSHTHYLLLKQLGITPLAARSEFFASLAAGSNYFDSNNYSDNSAANKGDGNNSIETASAALNIETPDSIKAVDIAAKTVTELGTEPHYQPIPANRFADDVNTILSQTSLRNWQIDINASQCQITEQTLITPPLPLLQQASQKRQLWQLLAGYLND